ncbi:MAG TPA: autotransporter-associated beta strand repeat-containing protein [Verrucomicrobiae bacterium]|jgi:fibronectin-binding autotransporter adhesin|nr:autotransporter-associated beta strand repeat-containing protein [Verrucomicrobiae bacterium]
MKITQSSALSVLASAITFLAATAVHSAPISWNSPSGGNWSVGANWSGGVIPGAADDVSFLDLGAGTTNTVDTAFTIDSLTYDQDDNLTDTTTINQGVTLQITDTGTGNVLYVGSTNTSVGASTQTPVTITGAGTLSLNGSGGFVVRQGFSGAGTHMATLDLSGLNSLNATVGQLLIGQAPAGNAVNRPSGTLLLAKTNNIVLNSATAPQLVVQDSGQNANGATVSLLELGQVTDIYADQMRLGGQKGNGTVEFNSSFTAPTAVLRNTDGASPCTLIACGDNSFANSGNNTVSIVDFSLGSVDALVNTVYVARGNPGPSLGTCAGTLNISAGNFAVNTTMIVGYQIATAASGAVTGLVNVGNSGAFSYGGTLSVAGTLVLAQTNASTSLAPGAVSGTLNSVGGTINANTIVAGGGASILTLGPGITPTTLTITNTAGTLAFPISSLTTGGTTFNLPASNAGATMVVSNLTAPSPNTINVTAIPPIATYPATFTLISYKTGDFGGSFNLGTLPSASPSYQGTIQDTGNGTVSLVLSTGPSTVLSLLWTGASGNSWDSATFNWFYKTYATNFFSGAAAVFNDTSTQTNVDLAESLSPGSVTVSNSQDLYTFDGPGNIAGSALLAKEGPGTLILDNAGVDTFEAVTITGTLQLGDDDTNGSLDAVTIADNGALVVDSTAAISLGSDISGTGSLSNIGSGALILSGSNSYSGATIITNGALVMNADSTGAGALTTSAGTVLAGSGTVNGPVTVGGEFNPGPLAGPGGLFTANDGLTMAAGSTLSFNLSPLDPSPTGSATIAVTGNLDLHNNQVTVNFSGTPPTGGNYPIITYTGNLSGSFNPVILGTHFAMTLDTSNPNVVYLTVTGSSGANLDWASESDPTWNSVTTNWLNLQTEQPSIFYTGDNVLLDDTPGVVTTLTIPAGVSVSPNILSNNSAANAFTISGAGQISGSASILKTNTSVFTIATANTFTGSVEVQNGVLATANGAALGNSSGTLVDSGATLDIDGQSLGGAIITASGPGYNNSGAVYNSSGTQTQGIRQLILDGDTSLGGTGNWSINNGGGTASLSTGGNPYSLIKVGANQIILDNLATFDTTLSNIDIQDGNLQFSGLTPNMGNPAATNIVESGAQLSFANGSIVWDKNFIFNGDGSDVTVDVTTGGNPVLNGNVQLVGDCVFDSTGIGLAISGVIAGDGGIIKEGSSEMTLSTNNTYTGDTTITTGSLILSTNGSIADSTPINIETGAALDVSHRSDSTLTLATGQTLEGTGTVDGSLIAGPGSIVSPGESSVGTLTVTNAVHLLGATSIGLDVINTTNSVLASGATITYGGVLDLTYLSGSPATGSSFKIFQAKSYAGSFSSISPATPGTGQTWDTSHLTTSGVIGVIVPGAPTPRFGGFTLSGTNFVFSGSNGVALANYTILTSTNLALPLAEWTPIVTNAFDSSGNFTFTNNVNRSLPQRFYLLETP